MEEASWKEECGVFGAVGVPRAAEIVALGLHALQHRGQEATGVVACGEDGAFQVRKGIGLVADVYRAAGLAQVAGQMAIGHNRYSTSGGLTLENTQPLRVVYRGGELALGHNGNLTNARELRAGLEESGSIFQTTLDSEVFLHLVALSQTDSVEDALAEAARQVQGAYSLVVLTRESVIALRDPHGFRPLCLGRLGDGYVVASETCALDLVGADFLREVHPGELVTIDPRGVRSRQAVPAAQPLQHCVFEHIYFSRPDSRVFGEGVDRVRRRLGHQLAREHPADADLVISVPDSSNSIALGFAEESGLRYELGLIRNHYIGRTFIQPTQRIRDFNVRVKLNLINEAVAGRRVVVVDDSIVRGTTARSRVVNLREAGAKEVHMRISCPPHRFACYYGIDFPDPEKLLANQCTMEEIRKYLGADSLGYLSLDGMVRATGRPESAFCTACFSGDYPVPFDSEFDKYVMEKRAGRVRLLEKEEPRLL